MTPTIINNSFTFFKTLEAAQKVAMSNAKYDPDWAYKVEQYPLGYVIIVYDEDGYKIGPI